MTLTADEVIFYKICATDNIEAILGTFAVQVIRDDTNVFMSVVSHDIIPYRVADTY